FADAGRGIDFTGFGRECGLGRMAERHHGRIRWTTRAVDSNSRHADRRLAIMAIMLTKKAEDKVKEIMAEQPEPYAGLRIQVVGGGCSGFQYRMGFDKSFNDQNDTVFEFDGLKIFIDK